MADRVPLPPLDGQCLYTAPPAPKAQRELTDEQINGAWATAAGRHRCEAHDFHLVFARAVIAEFCRVNGIGEGE